MFLSNKRVLVTGGTGSIGSELVKQILRTDASWIGILSNDENSLVQFKRELSPSDPRLRFFLGDVRDLERIRIALKNVDVVFHAAAIKHVDIAEYNPFDTIQTNVIGTQNIIKAALENEVEQVVGISTDKAAGPINVMGASKLLSEKLLIAANNIKGKNPIKFSVVRFGNVIGSRGSLIEYIASQIKKNKPVKITDYRMTRFIMTIKDAVKLVLTHAEKAFGGEIEILKMPMVRLETLINASIEVICEQLNKDPSTVDIVKIGPRAGEKIHEELLTIDESRNALETDTSYIIIHESLVSDQARAYWENKLGAKKAAEKPYISSDGPFMEKRELIQLLKQNPTTL